MNTENNFNSYGDVRDDRSTHKYRGRFSSSLSGIFLDPSNSTTDCCSLACGGILQSDYNRYLLTGIRPPTFTHRLLQHILVPLSTFCVAGYASFHIKDVWLNQIVCTALVCLTIGWIIGGCLRGAVKRAQVRRTLIQKLRNEYPDLDEPELSNFEVTCVHRGCGCANIDHAEVDHSKSVDICAKLSKLFSKACCGEMCGCWWQVCGICALAQEARQIKQLIPIQMRRMDYITFQPYLDYVNPLRKLREEKDSNILHHYRDVSKLSRMLLKTLVITSLCLFIFSLAGNPSFQLSNMLVFLATLLQAFLIIYFVHWHWHRFDLSLDAVIKYFASGFIFTSTTAIFFELILSLILKLSLTIIMNFSDIDTVSDQDGYQNMLFPLISQFDFEFGITSLFGHWNTLDVTYNEKKAAFQQKYYLIIIFYLFINAYVVAAVVEELSKYFGYRMVQHPDFMSEADLCEVSLASRTPGANRAGLDNLDVDGSGEEDKSYRNSEDETEGVNSDSHSDIPEGYTNQQEVQAPLYPAQPRTSKSIGTGITIAMVTVALGFACCENLVYVFVYSRKDKSANALSAEISVLVARSLFPVHPICAAIQSIGVCKKELENDRSIQLGRMVFPAILLHGSFDFPVMVLSFLSDLERKTDNGDGVADIYEILYSLLSLAFSIVLVLLGLIYYFKESRAQNRRLEQIDAARNFVGIRNGGSVV